MIEYYVWLQLCLGAGRKGVAEVLDYYGSPKAVFDTINLAESGLFTKKELEKFKTVSLDDAKRIVCDCSENGIQIVTIKDDRYPYCLSVIEDAPLLLYIKGNLPDFDNIPAICIVGPRKVSDFGKRAAYSLGFRMAASGMTVVSGGALGTDTNAHAGALKADGVTVVVLGCGILSDYLAENRKLREAAQLRGCLISEYPPKASASRFTFPVRNRILSALSLGTVVIEAGNKSGALITARHATEQGRDVFVIPGSPNKTEYTGSNALLRDGAKPLLDASDIFNEYIPRFPDKIDVKKAYEKQILSSKKKKITENDQKIQKNINFTLSKDAEIVYNCLDKQIFAPEEIGCPDIDSGRLLSALTELEMNFLIEAIPGGRFRKIQ